MELGGATPVTTSGIDVEGVTSTRRLPRPRRAISVATPVLSEVPQSATRSGPTPDPAGALERAQLAADVVEHHRIAGKSTRERRAGCPLACVYPPGADRFDGGR